MSEISEHPSVRMLKESLSSLEGLNEQGEGTVQELRRQREVLDRTQKNRQEVQEKLTISRSLLQRLQQWWRG